LVTQVNDKQSMYLPLGNNKIYQSGINIAFSVILHNKVLRPGNIYRHAGLQVSNSWHSQGRADPRKISGRKNVNSPNNFQCRLPIPNFILTSTIMWEKRLADGRIWSSR